MQAFYLKGRSVRFMSTHAETRPERIYSLDVLRGIAALSVVFWHWQHFFYNGGQLGDFTPEQQPFFDALSLLYRHGALAVEMFFCISGFVFFWLFATSIENKTLSPLRFFSDRFSRIYPLHIVTFALVAGLQLAYVQTHTFWFVYQANDAYHALLNILLVPAWGFEKAWSFNAPAWSVSIEALLYGIFFLLCLTQKFRYLLIPGLIALGAYIYPDVYKLGTGLLCFFCGGVAYIALDKAMLLVGIKRAAGVACLLATASWLYVGYSSSPAIYYLIGVNFPLTVMAVAATGFAFPGFMKPLSGIGDLSYSSYLLHFPLQIIFAVLFDRLGYGREIFYSPWLLGLFIAVLLTVSFASHRLFEVPVQRWLRARFRQHTLMPTSARD